MFFPLLFQFILVYINYYILSIYPCLNYYILSFLHPWYYLAQHLEHCLQIRFLFLIVFLLFGLCIFYLVDSIFPYFGPCIFSVFDSIIPCFVHNMFSFVDLLFPYFGPYIFCFCLNVLFSSHLFSFCCILYIFWLFLLLSFYWIFN